MGTLGEYRLLEKLGEGGMGTVYRALHTKLDRIVALKLLPQGRVDDARRLARFDREMKAVGRLNHPHIVQAYDAREIEGTTVLVMEYVGGRDLAEVARLHGPLAIADACEVVRQAAVGLQYAHVREPVPPIKQLRAGVPDGLVAVLDRMLAKSPDNRFATPGEVAGALERFARGSDLVGLSKGPGISPPTGPRATAAPQPPVAALPASRRWKPWTLAAALMLSLVLVVVGLQIIIKIYQGGRETTIEVPPGANVQMTTAEEREPAARFHVDVGHSTRDQFPDGPTPAVAPFGVRAAERHQQAWADYLKKPLEMVNSVEMEMVLIPQGEFEMGVSIKQAEELIAEARPHDMPPFFARHIAREVPKYRVEIPRPSSAGISSSSIYAGQDGDAIGRWSSARPIGADRKLPAPVGAMGASAWCTIRFRQPDRHWPRVRSTRNGQQSVSGRGPSTSALRQKRPIPRASGWR